MKVAAKGGVNKQTLKESLDGGVLDMKYGKCSLRY